MNLYSVIKTYNDIKIFEMVWADNEEEVYSILSWDKDDKPPLEIHEVTPVKGCLFSIASKS